jgi:hypothetical protein
MDEMLILNVERVGEPLALDFADDRLREFLRRGAATEIPRQDFAPH